MQLQKTMLLLACLMGFSGVASALGFNVDPIHSTVNYSAPTPTEAAVLDPLSGHISAQGAVLIQIPLQAQAQTMAVIQTQIDMPYLMQMPSQQRITLPATLELFGTSKQFALDVVVSKIYNGELMVTSMRPVMIHPQDFGSSQETPIAVNFVVSFTRS
ncbi:hypothetical protein THMIRHAS_05400 [Thiosulfatimonas sediminis]|uniref:Lipid/polyisoprenoid-binding YceI-like domain-containing protein n=2 Tax=Thiosulfatimonas sediminis TaxID=2675054 RepID=A0A6F8PT06_9GAMM|nr:hypothetical protein THMIRHAS_05400 [Thiosulfatimonas sediminis]